jgi:membrane peptidoglycan carboxypeptidase
VNDHRDRRHRRGEPAWPTGDDPDAAKWPRQGEPQKRTGFWSPLWEDDDDGSAPRANGRTGNGHHVTRTASPQPTGRTTRIVRPPGGPDPTGATVRLPYRAVPPRPRTPRDNSQDPTQVMPPSPGVARREPDLLTHREPELEEEQYLDEDRPVSDDQRRLRRKKIWRRIRRTMYVLLILMIVGPVLAFFITYQFVTVPSPNEVASGQARDVTIQYANGQELTKITPQDGSRTMVTWEELNQAQPVLHAVFAAEDNTFMTNAGFDLSGVLRASYNQLTGGNGGGSTITQQYIKQATNTEDRSLVNKGIEVVKAYKMNRTYSKEQIITAYLNTIYLGRNAYGIVAAAKAYYNKDLKSLTPSEAALLAGMIQSPGRYKDETYMQKRWNFVMDQLVANNWFPGEQRKTEQFPKPIPYERGKNTTLTGPRGLIQQAAYDELKSGPLQLSEEEIASHGYTIVTTVDPQAQDLAEQAVVEGMKGQPDNLRPALVAVDPKTGEIKAYYGGADGVGTDWAAAKQEPGSSWKPFDLVAWLETGKGLDEAFDGSSPRHFRGDPASVQRRNSDGMQCAFPCTVAEAMKQSINTVFFDITLDKLSPQKVLDAAHQAGITSNIPATNGIAIGGDQAQVSTVEMASAYATFAARGMYRPPHIVAKVLNPDGSLVWQAASTEKQAFDADPKTNEKIARNVTESLIPVPGYSKIPCADGRVCAGKTGTHQLGKTGDNAKAWMVGYTPQLSAAVSLSGKEGEAIKGSSGRDIYGAKVPGGIWKLFMDKYHKAFKLPKEDFGRFEAIGKGTSVSASNSSSNPKKPDPTTTTTKDRGKPPDPTTTTTTPPRGTRPPTTTLPPLPGPGFG